MSEMAEELGRSTEHEKYQTLASKIKTAFNKRFYDSTTGVYEYGNQSEYGMPLYYGLVDEENIPLVASKLADSVVDSNYKIKTGEIALKPVLMSLAHNGYNDIVYKMANQTDYPSYGYWVKQGATTTPEYWDMSYSQNHCMMDHIEEWFFSELAGIKNVNNDAFHDFVIKPYMAEDLTSQSTCFRSCYGEIVSEYTKEDNGLYSYHIVVPANSRATLRLSVGNGNVLYEKGKEIENGVNGVEKVEYADGVGTVVVGSGDYRFRVSAPTRIGEVRNAGGGGGLTLYTLSGVPANPWYKGVLVTNGRKYLKR